MSEDVTQKVIDFYVARETKKGWAIDVDKDENIRVIKCCDNWKLSQNLSDDEIQRLVTVDCPESRGLIKGDRRLLKDIAREADRQLRLALESGRDKEWRSERKRDFLEGLLKKLEMDENVFESDPIILRPKVPGEPITGSYYLQDGNHRMLAAGIFFLRNRRMPKVIFHIGGSIDKEQFKNHQ